MRNLFSILCNWAFASEVCSVLKINICSKDLQEIIFYKTFKKNLYCNQQRYFKWDYNPFQKQAPDVFYKKAVLKFCNILRKTPELESLFNKIVGLQACIFRPPTLLKRKFQHRCFPVNIAKFLRTSISKNSWKMFGYKKKALKCVIINFHVFMRAEQLISDVESQIGQNNRYEFYPDMNFISFLNM